MNTSSRISVKRAALFGAPQQKVRRIEPVSGSFFSKAAKSDQHSSGRMNLCRSQELSLSLCWAGCEKRGSPSTRRCGWREHISVAAVAGAVGSSYPALARRIRARQEAIPNTPPRLPSLESPAELNGAAAEEESAGRANSPRGCRVAVSRIEIRHF